MKQLRLWMIVGGGLVVLAALLVLVDFVLRIQGALALISPLLAQGFVLLVGVGAIAAIGYGLYQGRKFLRPRRQRPTPKLPEEKVAVAQTALTALEQQVAQIQDQVAQAALREQSRQLATDLDLQDLRVVVFGVGSVGKTALVNQLLGDIVGTVAAPLGSTTVAATYPLRLPGLEQTLWLTDTPGLLEARAEGPEREAQVRQLAADADLLLFVIDNDLRQSEYALACDLLKLGKRLVVVFNKVDLYPEEDLAEILAAVRSRFHGQITPEDVVDIAAQPQAVQLPSGEWAQMDPDLWPLEERLTAVLREEGADLLAETILLRSQRLSSQARDLIDQQRRQQSDRIIDRYQWINAGVVAASPLPGVDLLATAAINAQMVVELGKVYQWDLSLEEGKVLASSLARTLTGLGIVKGAMRLLAVGMQVTVATALASRAVQGASAAYLTRIAGKSFVEYFRQGQDWGDGGVNAVVEQQFQLNRREAFITDFVKQAITVLDQV
ncbi:MAG: YcjF family protein [Leptolyngbyaceae cyanobacterium]